MEHETSKGYALWGHAIEQQQDLLAPDRYAASGTDTRAQKLVEASGILELFDTSQISCQQLNRSAIDRPLPFTLGRTDCSRARAR
ncbi:hypothetical protein P5W99_37255 [Paraburkholderia sp. A3BS-1L]|uniref:hypothetical protein n=1 Tax=Paraburkholderia sp. A3BS-1L TaxID=3028375 RepID=UPI003DAA11FD